MIDLQRLRYFAAVARHQHVGRAARELHISQSPLSRQIIALEAELGLRLFTREKKRLRLTEHGRHLLGDAERLLEGASALERRAHSLAAGGSGRLIVGYVPAAVYTGVLPRELERLRRRAPSAVVELVPMRSAEQIAALETGAIDLGYAHSPAPREGFRSRLRAEEPFLLVAPRGGKMTFRERATSLRDQPFITLPESAAPRVRAEMLAACGRVGLGSAVGTEASEPMVVLALVAAGLGYAIVQESLRHVAPRTVQLVRLPARFGLRVQVHRLARATPPSLVQLLEQSTQ
jgi:DNA-binding transcriptional LysR family regulator